MAKTVVGKGNQLKKKPVWLEHREMEQRSAAKRLWGLSKERQYTILAREKPYMAEYRSNWK